MVKQWRKQIEWGIKKTTYRLKLMEKHGKGIPIMEEKAKLVKQKKQLIKYDEDNK